MQNVIYTTKEKILLIESNNYAVRALKSTVRDGRSISTSKVSYAYQAGVKSSVDAAFDAVVKDLLLMLNPEGKAGGFYSTGIGIDISGTLISIDESEISHDNIADVSPDDHHSETHILATIGPHTGSLPLTDLASGTAGDIITRQVADWATLTKGTAGYVLTMGATYPEWAATGTCNLINETENELVTCTANPDELTGEANLTFNGTNLDINGGIKLLVGATVDTIETTLTDDDTHLPTSGVVYDAINAVNEMVYPGAGIALSTGTAWGTSIVNNSADWNTAYGWGDHASAGYLTSYTETDPVFGAHAASGITSTNITNWNTAYGWGDHASEGYLTSLGTALVDADFASNGIMKRTAAGVYGIITDASANWNTAYGWGDHAGLYEPVLGNPTINGQILSSTTAGERSWITYVTGGNSFYQSFTSQTSVTVTHNFDAYPVIDIIDNTGKVIIPLSITHNNVNSFTVTFSGVTSGVIVATYGTGETGATGEGVIVGGTANQVLAKIDATDYNTQWVDQNAAMTYPGAGIALSTGTAWGASITNNSANWNTAYGWGNWASNFGTTAGKITQGNDSRLSNSRTPTQHAMDSTTYHLSTDITTLNATTSKHGFLPKLGGGTTNFLRADGTWASIGEGGDITLGENTSIALDPAGSADGKYTGITITGVAGATLAFGDLIYLAVATSKWVLTDADATATSGTPMMGMCVLAAADTEATKILLMGLIRADAKFPTLTVGAPAYVGETAGVIQVAIPTGADNVIRVVGRAMTANELYFNPSQDHQVVVA